MRTQCHRIGRGSKRVRGRVRPLLVGVFLGHIHKRGHVQTAHQRPPPAVTTPATTATTSGHRGRVEADHDRATASGEGRTGHAQPTRPNDRHDATTSREGSRRRPATASKEGKSGGHVTSTLKALH